MMKKDSVGIVFYFEHLLSSEIFFYPPLQKTMGSPMDECTKSYGVISPRTMGG